jgi:hypothetical protein
MNPPPTPPLIDPLTGKAREKRFVSVIRAERWWTEKARKDPAFFIHYLSGLQPARHHKIWLANLFHPDRHRINLIAPRDSGKSTILAYAMAYKIGSDPLSTNGIVSVSADQAEKRMRMIHGIINNNTRYKNVYPHIHLDTRFPDTQTEFTVWSSENKRTYNNWRRLVENKGSAKDPTIRIGGRGGRVMIGSRFSGWLLLDDIIDREDLNDKAQEEVERYLMETLEPAVKEEGKIVNIGTRWMPMDLPERLKQNEEWHTVEIQATLKDANGNRHSYWPEYWPLEKLDKKRRTMKNDALYFIMYENDPTAIISALFAEQHLRRDVPMPLPAFKQLFVSTDFATSLKQRADFTVFQVLGVAHNNDVYLVRQKRMKKDINSSIDELVRFSHDAADTYGRFDGILVEKVTSSAAVRQILSKVDPRLPVHDVSLKGDKGHRASILADWVRRGKFFIHQGIEDLEILISEWINFTLESGHDDTLDTSSLLFQHLNLEVVASAEVKQVHSQFLI